MKKKVSCSRGVSRWTVNHIPHKEVDDIVCWKVKTAREKLEQAEACRGLTSVWAGITNQPLAGPGGRRGEGKGRGQKRGSK